MTLRSFCLCALASFALASGLSGIPGASAQCSYTPLTSGVAVPTTAVNNHYSFDQGFYFWSAVAIRTDLSSEYYIGMYETAVSNYPQCLDGPIIGEYQPQKVSLVIADFGSSYYPPDTYYIYTQRGTGSSGAWVQWDDGPDYLYVNDVATERTWGSGNIIEVWNVTLQAGLTYSIHFAPSTTSYKLLLFRPVLGPPAFNRNTAELEVGSSTTYTPATSGDYAVAVISEDGASGSFSLGVGACTSPQPLTAGTTVFTSRAENYYSCTQQFHYWSAVGVRGDSDWDIQAYLNGSGGSYPDCLGSIAATSGYAPPKVDFVVGDFDYNTLGAFYVRPHLYDDTGSGTAAVQWDDGPDVLDVNGLAVTRDTDWNSVLEVWDVRLEEGTTYTFRFARAGAADLKMLLFRNPTAGTYWAGRSAAVFEATGDQTYTAPASDWYGLVVVNDDGGTGSYTASVGTCSTPIALLSGVPRVTDKAENYLSFQQMVPYWTAVGVRGNSDWDIDTWSSGSGGPVPDCFENLLARSSLAPPYVDFIVADFNYIAPGIRYAHPYLYRDAGGFPGVVEWEGGSDAITVGGPTISRTLDGSHVLEVWDVRLEAGTQYTFQLNPSGAADLKQVLFRNRVSGIYWAPRADAEFEDASWQTYTAPTTGYYGLVVVNENGASGSYTLRVDAGVVAVNEPLPRVTAVTRVAPNPSRGRVRIDYALGDPGFVAFEVYDISGRRVAALPEEPRGAGQFSLEWDGRAGAGVVLPDGVYFLRMSVDGRTAGQKTLLLMR